jgi:eukaryotic-like serine/threonine-protein kinase
MPGERVGWGNKTTMTNLDAATVAAHAASLRLLTQEQVLECWDEVDRTGPADQFLRMMERKGYLTPWQSQKLLKMESDGYFLGGARILYKIASGSYGRVYRAEDPRTGRMLAIKLLRRKWSENKHVIELFEREGKMGMALRHPNIVEILNVNLDRASHQHFITMEFVEGGNLRDFLGIRKKLEAEEMLRILEECTSGLAFAFSHGVTHRDMKASNILISSQKTAKLVDFGLAGVRKQTGYDPMEVSVERTVDYAGLEMSTGVVEGDTRSDIFFLGCVTYQMLTGRFPLEMSRNAKSRMSKERFTNFKPIQPDEVKYPSVIRLVENMMSLDPLQRYQTPSQLLDGVRDVRRELQHADKPQGKSGIPSTIFIAEKDESLQDLFREKFKARGLRVLLAADPARALDRFRQQPFDVLVVDVGTTGESGLYVFERILNDARANNLTCSGVLILGEDQAHWQEKISDRPNQIIMVQPVKFKQLFAKIQELLGLPVSSTGSQPII